MENTAKKPFTGTFYFVTQYSVLQVQVDDLEKTPSITKVAFRGDRAPRVVPVGGILKPRFYWAITNAGIIAFRMSAKQASLKNYVAAPIEGLPNNSKGRGTKCPIAFFFKRDDADECLDWASRQKEILTGFDPDHDYGTIPVLKAIGLNHPLLVISRADKGNRKYGLPKRLLDAISES